MAKIMYSSTGSGSVSCMEIACQMLIYVNLALCHKETGNIDLDDVRAQSLQYLIKILIE
jgi:hypothetical protein